MEVVQVQLPAVLVEQVQQISSPDRTLEQVFVEAVQIWLQSHKHDNAKTKEDKASLFLIQSGLVMTSERQSTFARSIKLTLEVDEIHNREEIEASLANLNPLLSEEIIAMRGERKINNARFDDNKRGKRLGF